MAIAYNKLFQPTVLTASLVTIYTVPLTPTSNLLRGARIRLTNTSAAAMTARLHAVPVAGSAANGNAFFFDQTVPANAYVDVDVPVMGAGDFIQSLASATPGINIQSISGGIFST
jgi:hypothetical protein